MILSLLMLLRCGHFAIMEAITRAFRIFSVRVYYNLETSTQKEIL